MKPENFYKEAPGRLIKVGLGEIAYWAYVPAPLPPKLRLDNKLWKSLSNADRAIGELAGLGQNIPNPHLGG